MLNFKDSVTFFLILGKRDKTDEWSTLFIFYIKMFYKNNEYVEDKPESKIFKRI